MEESKKVVCMLRVKDGILFIERWLENIGGLVDEIVVVDNGSKDGTVEILETHQKVKIIKHTEGFHEGRDLKILLNIAQQRNPDWLIGLDVDEIFEERITREHFDQMMCSKRINSYGFRRYHMIEDLKHFISGTREIIELSRPSRFLYRNSSNLFVEEKKIHCYVQGISKPTIIARHRIKHLCNLNVGARLKTYENYLNVDPDNNSIYKRDINILEHNQYSKKKWTDGFIYRNLEYLFLNMIFIIWYMSKSLMKKWFRR